MHLCNCAFFNCALSPQFPPISPTCSFVLFCDLPYLLLVVCLSIGFYVQLLFHCPKLYSCFDDLGSEVLFVFSLKNKIVHSRNCAFWLLTDHFEAVMCFVEEEKNKTVRNQRKQMLAMSNINNFNIILTSE